LYSKVPVLTAPLSALPEAAGPHAFYAHPDHPEELSVQIDNALTNSDLRNMAIEKGFEHALQFDAEKLTGQMMRCYQVVMSEGMNE
jgi:hypothetical protein